MKMLRVLVFGVLASAAAGSQACRVAPPAQRIAVEYSFLVLDQMRGLPRKVFTVLGRASTPYDQDGSYDRHRDFAFWGSEGGRVVSGAAH